MQWLSEFLQYDFMRNALAAILIITPLFGILGTMIVNNKLAFFSDALGHSAFTGMAAGIILGVTNRGLSMVIFGVLFALLLNYIRRRGRVSTDTVISVFSSVSTAAGLVILSMGGNFSEYSSLLVGDILSIGRSEILSLLVILVFTLIFWGAAFNKLLAASINPSLARSKGIRIALIENIFSVLIAVIVMLSIRWVGVLIINALLILPAAAARNIASDMREYHLFSCLIAVFSGVNGLVLSYFLNTAAGPTIVILSGIIFFITLLTRKLVKQGT